MNDAVDAAGDFSRPRRFPTSAACLFFFSSRVLRVLFLLSPFSLFSRVFQNKVYFCYMFFMSFCYVDTK
ncbi:MAG: hypothetical protein BM485_15875 [Desulfobulbaceae bacterium DB1]|nr:MAG: hypothetical protein BM485_15875 [Desulfobulbaceae bacterium DB1]